MNYKLSKKEGLKENKEKYEKELKEKQEELDKINKTLSEKELEIEDDKRKLEENVEKICLFCENVKGGRGFSRKAPSPVTEKFLHSL